MLGRWNISGGLCVAFSAADKCSEAANKAIIPCQLDTVCPKVSKYLMVWCRAQIPMHLARVISIMHLLK